MYICVYIYIYRDIDIYMYCASVVRKNTRIARLIVPRSFEQMSYMCMYMCMGHTMAGPAGTARTPNAIQSLPVAENYFSATIL